MGQAIRLPIVCKGLIWEGELPAPPLDPGGMGYNSGKVLTTLPGGATDIVAAAETLPFGMATTDPNGTVTWANLAYATWRGCAREEVIGRSAGEFPFAQMRQAAPGSQPWRGANHTITVLRDAAGAVTGFCLLTEKVIESNPDQALLRQYEAGHAALIESTADLIWSVDRNYRLVTFNRALQEHIEKSFGIRAGVGMGPYDLLTHDKASLWPPLYERALTQGPFRQDFPISDGRTLELAFNPIRMDGQVVAVSVFGKDITERKTAEKVLREAEQEYRALFENALEGIYRTTPEGQILTANPALAAMLGYGSPAEGIAALTNSAAHVWVDVAERARFVQMVEAQGTVRNFECRFRRKDGSTVWASLTSRKVCDGNGRTLYLEGHVEGISDRKRAEDALRKSQDHFAKLFRCSPTAVILSDVDAGDLLVDVNEAFERASGYTREEAIGRTSQDLGLWANPAEFEDGRRQFQAAGRLTNFEFHFRRKSGEVGRAQISSEIVEFDGLPYVLSATSDITRLKQAEALLLGTNEALAKAESHYRRLFNSVSDVVLVFKLEPGGVSSPVVDVNDNACRFLGYTREELLRLRVADIDAPENRVNAPEIVHQLFTVGQAIREQLVVTKDGRKLPVEINSHVFDLDGSPTMISCMRDISERRRIERALRESEERFVKAFQSIPAILSLSDATDEGRFLHVNEAFERLCGYSRKEAIGRSSVELGMWAEDPNEYAESERLFARDGRLRNFEHRFRTRSGEVRTGLTSSEIVEIGGKPVALTATVDITEQKKTDEAMRSLATAIEQAGEAVVITDLDGVIQYLNPAFQKATGYAKEEAIGQSTRLMKSGKHSPEFYADLWSTIRQGRVWTGRMINRRKDGSLLEEDATISPIRDAAGRSTGYVAVKRDITRQRQLEDQLRQAQKMESIGRLAGGVAHDFNNLLTVINGYSSFLLKGLKKGDPLRSFADEIRVAGERAASLTRQLLAFSRKQTIEPRLLDLNATVRESAPMLQRLIGEDIALKTRLDGSLGQVMADPDQIHQVIMNLAVNARDAMPNGGTLDIESRNVEMGEAAANAGRFVLLTVTDNGQGMDEATKQQIFEPFFTTKGVGKGTGLGLSTVYGIVQQSGGFIDVTSEVGHGTSFGAYFPRQDSAPAPEGSGPAPQRTPGAKPSCWWKTSRPFASLSWPR